MCLPIPVLAGIGLASSLASAAVGAVGETQSANAQAAAAEANANVQRRQAAIEQTAGQQEARRKQEQANKMIGTQLAQYAGSGVTIEGSPMDVMADTRRETFLDQQAVLWNANLKSENLNYSAKISDMNAIGYRKTAGLAVPAGIAKGFAAIGSKNTLLLKPF